MLVKNEPGCVLVSKFWFVDIKIQLHTTFKLWKNFWLLSVKVNFFYLKKDSVISKAKFKSWKLSEITLSF